MENLFSMLSNQLDGQNLAQLQQMLVNLNMPQMQEMMDNIHLNTSSSSAAAESMELKKMEKEFEQELARAKKSEEFNKRTPTPCPSIDRAAFLSSFNMRLSQTAREDRENPGKGLYRMRNTWITGL
jgi:hypothetical protein